MNMSKSPVAGMICLAAGRNKFLDPIMSNKIKLTDIPSPVSRHWGIQNLSQGWKPETFKPHQHEYDEYAVIWKGRVVMHNDGVNTEYVAGDVIRFPAHQLHGGVEALEDTEYFWSRGD
jgi:mannose-6-phosphate isomerase-like protein (cupin superfamily)